MAGMDRNGAIHDQHGRYSEKNNGHPGGDTDLPDDARPKTVSPWTAVDRALMMVSRDTDIRDTLPWANYRLNRLLADATVTRGADESDDKRLLIACMEFSDDPDAPGGSHSDYLASALASAWADYSIHVGDRDRLVRETRRCVANTAIDPDRTLRELGQPPLTDTEISEYTPQSEQPMPVPHRPAPVVRPDVRRQRTDQATQLHVGPLDDRMRALYKGNVDRGLINGSAFEDRMAFADALYELQQDGWDPDQGKEYRRSTGFKRLEKQLLAGRKPTRRYRQMRDALCDNETEYRAFMTANPDVFDPNEKIVKPFCGLGPDVGQQAMLRLTAKHRGVTGALQVARRDPAIVYTIGDAKTHTFATTLDQYPGDDEYTHRAVTANGIKPASIMSWIHGETPDSPAWEQRARRRFTETHGGQWKPTESDRD